jgi:hypothetical protein
MVPFYYGVNSFFLLVISIVQLRAALEQMENEFWDGNQWRKLFPGYKKKREDEEAHIVCLSQLRI